MRGSGSGGIMLWPVPGVLENPEWGPYSMDNIVFALELPLYSLDFVLVVV
jgi:hypothetical protein